MAFAGQAARDHMRVVLADDPADGAQFGRAVVIRAELPGDLAGLFADDENDVGFAAVHDQVVGMEALVARIIPLVGTEHGHGVDVHPVAHAFGQRGAVVGVAAESVLGTFAKAHFMEVLVAGPFPDDVAVPVHFQNKVVQKQLVRNILIADVAVGQDQGVARINPGFHARRVVAHGVAFALEIMVVAGHPASGNAGIFNVFILVEFPDDIAVPVHLNQIQSVLDAVFSAAPSPAGQQIAAGKFCWACRARLSRH